MNLLSLSYFFCLSHLILPLSMQSLVQTTSKYSKKRENHNKITQRIVNHCFNDIIGNFVTIGEWIEDDVLFSKTILSDSKPVYLFDAKNGSFRNYKNIDKINRTIKVYPSTNVTVMVSSKKKLTKILNDLKESIWWNHEANFLIVNNDQTIGCSLAHQFLQIIWNFNILSAIYICFNDNQVRMYTFNPYDQTGTDFWIVAWVSNAPDNYWTMFKHEFDEAYFLNNVSFNCNDLNLRRTDNLNQFNIRIGARKVSIPKLSGQGTREMVNDINIILVILSKLNATYTFKSYRKFGFCANSDLCGFQKDLESSNLNLVSNLALLSDTFEHYIYPYEFNSVCIVTPKNTDIQYIASFTPRDGLILAIIFLISIIVIKCVFHQTVSTTLLEILRMLTGSAFSKKTSRTKDSFFLISIIFAIYITSIFLQVRLTTYRTVPNNARQIDTLEDVINSDLVVSGSNIFQMYIFNEKIFKKFVDDDTITCFRDIVAGKKKACLMYCRFLRESNFSYFVHETKEPLTTRPSAFVVSSDWPLLSKFNSILSYMVQSGIYRYKSITYQATYKWGMPQQRRHLNSVINLEELRLSIYLFLGGCSLATTVLLIECCVYKINNLLRTPADLLKKVVPTIH